MTSFSDLMKYAQTGIGSGLSEYEKKKALALFGGGGIPENTIEGVPPLTFNSDGTPLKAWTMYGNVSVSGTPVPTNPIYPSFVGNNSGEDEFYDIPVTLGGVTETVTFTWYPLAAIGSYTDSYSGDGTWIQWIDYIDLNGDENWGYGATQKCFYCDVPEGYADYMRSNTDILMICSHYESILQVSSASKVNRNNIVAMYYGSDSRRIYIRDERFDNTTDFKAFLREQYANKTPVRIYYVLAACYEYSDYEYILTPTVGVNTLSFGTTVQPSRVSITGRIS